MYVYDFNTTKIERVTHHSRYNASPKLTYDNRYLYVLTRTERGFDVARLGLSDQSWEILTHDGHIESYDVASNGKVIVYTTNIGSSKVLKFLSVPGKIARDFAIDSKIAKDPTWSQT